MSDNPEALIAAKEQAWAKLSELRGMGFAAPRSPKFDEWFEAGWNAALAQQAATPRAEAAGPEDMAVYRAISDGYHRDVAQQAATPTDPVAAFEEAMRQTWRMIDPLHPAGQPGSYARGQDAGIIAALKTVRENFERLIARQAATPAPAEPVAWGVALCWSSSNPSEQVRCLADGEKEVREFEAHHSFIRWLHIEPPATPAAP